MSAVEQRIASEIALRHGLTQRGDWSTSIRRVLGELAPVGNGSLAGSLDGDTLDKVAGNLTISETFFMRHHSQLEYAAEHLAQRVKACNGTVRALSAGCSSGEEPYSLVLCAMRHLGSYSPSQLEIQGCDLSPVAIEKARKAEYGNWSFRGVPPWLLEEHFESLKPGLFRLCESVRKRVALHHASISDVLAGYADGSVDVVLFRNVGIYLVEDYLRGLFAQFRRVLRPDGVLIVAPSDPRPAGVMFKRVPHDSTSVYAPQPHCAPTSTRSEDAPRRRIDDRPNQDAAARPVPAAQSKPASSEFPSSTTIREMADRGDLDAALELAAQLAARHPMDPESHLLHGQLHLAGTRSDDRRCAIDSLRRAVFIAPEHPLARFWYANALLADGRNKKALGQLSALSSMLKPLSGDLALDEGMTVSDLREAQAFLMEGLT